ncbi:MAG: uracil-DNA glycosylase family protein [Planctomycetota bacterium]|jgi:uracil-DNA glycosylase
MARRQQSLNKFLDEVRACTICQEHLPLGPRPVLAASKTARILLVGQAPGTRVHETGVPWNDPSGDRLRDWLRMDREQFYDAKQIAIVPMGFCYPGRGKSGDLPPRPECAETWHDALLGHMPKIELTILLGQYALERYLGEGRKKTLTETVKAWKEYRPKFLALPHPSPRNNLWLRKNPWFEKDVVPYLRRRVKKILA